MIPVLLISSREFLEAFLIIGVFLGISKKLKLRREKEILLASATGIIFSILLPVLVFFLGDRARHMLTGEHAELLEAYLMIFSGFFIAYVVLSLHKMFAHSRSKLITSTHQKLQKNIFDFSLFLTISFFIIREGFEIALFTATASLFSTFMSNITGLVAGFFLSAVCGVFAFFAYLRFPIRKVFKTTEYLIILLGATFVKNGFTELVDQYAHFKLSTLLPLPLNFLPGPSTFFGHMIHNLAGLEQDFSGAKLLIMTVYAGLIYFLFFHNKVKHSSP